MLRKILGATWYKTLHSHLQIETVTADIRKADRTTIKEFAKKIPTAETVPATLGTVGLADKYAVESVFGEVYPSKHVLKSNTVYRHRLQGLSTYSIFS